MIKFRLYVENFYIFAIKFRVMRNPFKTKEYIDNHTGIINISDEAPVIGGINVNIKNYKANYMSKYRETPQSGQFYERKKPFCTISLELLYTIMELTAKARRLVSYIACNIQPDYNYIKLDFIKVKEAISVSSDVQVYQAIKELKDINLIKELAGNDKIFVINHNDLFKGSYDKFIDKIREQYNVGDENDSEAKYDIIEEDKYVGRIKRYNLPKKCRKEIGE